MVKYFADYGWNDITIAFPVNIREFSEIEILAKRIILNVLVAAILLVICSGVAMAERFTVASKVANIRSGPGTKHEILWKIEKYHPLFVLKKSGQWYYTR